jgi:adenine-specific DNA-methyltransferase
LVRSPDLFFTYMNHLGPQLVRNTIRATHLNSVHGVYLSPALRRLGMDLLPLATLNSLTLVGAETVGRSYGGGMLKLEPKEADRLPVPAPALVAATRSALTSVRSRVARRLAAGDLTGAVSLVDHVLLVDHLGVREAALAALREAYAELSGRRLARGGRPDAP